MKNKLILGIALLSLSSCVSVSKLNNWQGVQNELNYSTLEIEYIGTFFAKQTGRTILVSEILEFEKSKRGNVTITNIRNQTVYSGLFKTPTSYIIYDVVKVKTQPQ